ncbi:hypothetical protein TNCV_2450921 [Trichonephila clavipes]|nr:hypothetical protein TNCV_2450921 [Trichonephila clavipes]
MHRITTWYYAHDDINGQRIVRLLVTSPLCLEELNSLKPSCRDWSLHTPSSRVCSFDCIQQERQVRVQLETYVVDATRKGACLFRDLPDKVISVKSSSGLKMRLAFIPPTDALEDCVRLIWVMWARTTFLWMLMRGATRAPIVDEFHEEDNRRMDWPSRSLYLTPIEGI